MPRFLLHCEIARHYKEDQWRRVTAVSNRARRMLGIERQQIARAVAMIQTIVGPQTGTDAHQWTHWNMLVLPNGGDLTQLDCIDTSVNTWTYMTLMERSGLFAFHRVAPLSYAPLRNTAVLQEINGGYFAIDASLVDVGVPPPVMPLSTCLGAWPPIPPRSKAWIERMRPWASPSFKSGHCVGEIECLFYPESGHSPHSIISSAICWRCTGTSRPNAMAVLRLMTS